MESTATRSSDVDRFRLSRTTAALGGGPLPDSSPGALGGLGALGACGSVDRREVP